MTQPHNVSVSSVQEPCFRKIDHAKWLAQDVAELPLTEALFAAIGLDSELPGLEIADEVRARLLDIAVLLGDVELAERCLKNCRWKPLRRWKWDDFVFSDEDGIWITNPEVLEAALAAGVELAGLCSATLRISLHEAVILASDPQLLSRVGDLLKPRNGDPTIARQLPIGWSLGRALRSFPSVWC